MSFRQVIEMSDLGGDRYRGPGVPSEMKRTFGGQVVGQALQAAQQTVEGKTANSLHAYFVGGGLSAEPIDFTVHTVRDGRTFSHRRVTGWQGDKEIVEMLVSFRRPGDQGPEHAAQLPDVPGPEECRASAEDWPSTSRIVLGEWSDWDVLMVPDEHDNSRHAQDKYGAGARHIWFRYNAGLGDDPALNQVALSYLSDMTLLNSTLISHPEARVQMASLDHSLWFFDEIRVDEWLLYEQDSPFAGGGRGFAQGRVYRQDGALVAQVSQEGLIRWLKE
ncbi:acyl-CoA thioesterase [Corynebacterium sp. LK2522]|uniref:acyl-CoA thioesterase n=1 Tax=Corynebacterium sp. LK2522 TaxID=3110474 RepID=UPI0034CFDC0E